MCSSCITQARTELHDAAEKGDLKRVQRLLSTSISINSRTIDVRLLFLTLKACSTGLCTSTILQQETALLLASKRNHVEVVCLLLKAGAALIIPDKVLMIQVVLIGMPGT